MTSQQSTGPIPWRVKTRVNRATFFGPAMTEAEAVRAAQASAEQCRAIGDGGSFVAVETRYGVVAWVRGRDVVSIEPVGPRWDGVDDNARPERVPTAPDHAPAHPDPVPTQPEPITDDRRADLRAVGDDEPLAADGTRWLKKRTEQQQSRKRGRR